MPAPLPIFVVDDDPDVRDALAMQLVARGYTVRCFASGEELLAGLEPGARGGVLLDVRMPGRDGIGILQALGAAHPALPVAMITGHGDVPLAVKAMRAGALDFVEKPFGEGVVLDAVERLLTAAELRQRRESSQADALAAFAELTPRERQVLALLVAGHPNKVIAHHLGISARTVEIHRQRVMEKSGARTLSHLVRLALTAGLGPG